MDLIKVLENIDKISKDGIPLNHSVETKTVNEFGGYILGGFAVCGLITGLIIGLAIYLVSPKR